MKNIMKLLAVRHDFYRDNPGVGADELHLLEKIAISEDTGYPLSVTDAMSIRSVASPATIHRHLERLIENDLVKQKFEGDNRRTKYLFLTAKGNRYFNKLDRLIGRMA